MVVEVLAPGHHNLACVGFGGEVVPGQDLVFEGREERLRSGVIPRRQMHSMSVVISEPFG